MSDSKTTISINEHLSAVLDDEAGSFEQRRVLDELKSDDLLRNKLSNFALIGETLRTNDTENQALTLGSSFLDSIHEQIALEDEFDEVVLGADKEVAQVIDNSQAKVASKSFLPQVGGFAVAASVGALAFMGLQNIGLINGPSSQPSNIVDSSGPTAIAQSAPVVNQTIAENTTDASTNNDDEYVDADARTRSLLKRYVDSHMQYATTSTFVPSVRVIAYTDNQ